LNNGKALELPWPLKQNDLIMNNFNSKPALETLPCVEGSLYRFSTEDFYRMVDLDIFPKGNRANLWDGIVYEKPPKSTVHAAVGAMMNMKVWRCLLPGWFVSLDNSITIGPDRSPAPDLAVIRGEPEDYRYRRPEAADAGLFIEMTDSILKNNVERKAAAYASVGIPTYVVLDLDAQIVRVHELPIPSENRYASVVTLKPGESFVFALDRVEVGPVAASDLLLIR
jgi:Uma2 family endonuclease